MNLFILAYQQVYDKYGIIHCDIKGNNILTSVRDENGVVSGVLYNMA